MGKNVKINAVETTAKLLEILSREGGMGVGEVAEKADMPKSTAHDYLRSLDETGYLVRNSDGYVLSTRLLEQGARRRLDMEVYQTAKPQIKKLAWETGEHATLMIEENCAGILLSTMMGDDAVEVVANDGTRTPLHATAPGRTIMANLAEDRVNEILNCRGLPQVTKHTITDRDELMSELELIREQGYASEKGEIMDGMRGVGAPIIRRDTEAVLGAVSVYGPISRTNNKEFEETIPQLLIEAANVIELNMTY